MHTPSAGRDYHVVEFVSDIEAAAFAAALSRFLISPRGTAYMTQAEVWIGAPGTHDVVTVYLSDAALEAASTAFAPPPVTGTRRGEDVPPDCALVIGGDATPAWGLVEAQRRLMRRER